MSVPYGRAFGGCLIPCFLACADENVWWCKEIQNCPRPPHTNHQVCILLSAGFSAGQIRSSSSCRSATGPPHCSADRMHRSSAHWDPQGSGRGIFRDRHPIRCNDLPVIIVTSPCSTSGSAALPPHGILADHLGCSVGGRSWFNTTIEIHGKQSECPVVPKKIASGYLKLSFNPIPAIHTWYARILCFSSEY